MKPSLRTLTRALGSSAKWKAGPLLLRGMSMVGGENSDRGTHREKTRQNPVDR